MAENPKGVLTTDSCQRPIAWQMKADTGRMKETLDTPRPDTLGHRKTWGSFQDANLNCQNASDSRVGVPLRILPFPIPLHAEVSRAEDTLLVPGSCSTDGRTAAWMLRSWRASALKSSMSSFPHRL